MPFLSPTVAYILSTGLKQDGTGGTIDNNEKGIGQLQDFSTPLTEAYDFKTELNHIEHNLNRFKNFKIDLDENNHLTTSLLLLTDIPSRQQNVSTVTKGRTPAKKIKSTATKRSLRMKTKSGQQHHLISQENNTKSKLWNNRFDVRTTTRSQRLTKKVKSISLCDKKSNSTLKGIPQANFTFLHLDKAIVKSRGKFDAMKALPPNLKPNNARDNVRKFKNVYHDYFNDLLVWHNDTLNKNISANNWDLIKGLNENTHIMPAKLAGITKEVNLMKQYLTSFEVLPRGNLIFIYLEKE